MKPTMNMMLRSAALVAGLAALPGCPLVDAQADVPDVCLTYPNLQVQTPEVDSVTRSFVFDDLSKVADLVKHEASLEFTRAELRVTSGLDDLSFVEAFHLVVSTGDPKSMLPPLTIYDCDGDCAPEGDTLTLPAGLAKNAIDYLRTSSIKVDLGFQGKIPAASWTMDIDVCMKGSAGYTVSP
jgi:hypothetical protein